MSPAHCNPTRPRIDKDKRQFWARAPYNFVPMPEKIVPARLPLLDHGSYHPEGVTGWIDCELQTCSPVYVRGMMTVDRFASLGQKKADEWTDEDRKAVAPFFSTKEGVVEGLPVPAIPGSTLRGMIRNLVEIVGYGRIRWVAGEPIFTFRAVAAPKQDPLSRPYRNVMGSASRSKVLAGYLAKRGDDWSVIPSKTPESMGWTEEHGYLKVSKEIVEKGCIPGYLGFDSEGYRPQVHEVSFDIGRNPGKPGFVTRVGVREAGCKYRGVLVCSGNMKEAGQSDQQSPRTTHALVLEPDAAKPLKISRQAVEDYLAGMTSYQKDEKNLVDWGGPEWGCLKEGKPVFYVSEGNEVAYFGHSPNFRIPARLIPDNRAASPKDFVPETSRSASIADLADSIFGWAEEADEHGKEAARAGRVFFSDANFLDAKDGVWLETEPIAPHTLSEPKPSTFQHYLVQDPAFGHDPDSKETLAHFGTSPGETEIRGFKLYWHKGNSPDIKASDEERKPEKQLTRIIPLKPGVKFRFKIHFENLREEELGAILWVLALPGETGRTYRHKLGMGKPLGMGAVAISSGLYLTGRRERYRSLFSKGQWNQAARAGDAPAYVAAFEKFMLKDNGIGPDKESLAEVERIRMLLALLEWREGSPEWLEATRYMSIQYGAGKINEYKERPVLPDPLAVSDGPRPRSTADKAEPGRPDKRAAGGTIASSAVRRGVVKRFDDQKGYGFITQADGTDIFVHHTGILGSGRKSLRQGQQVTYKLSTGRDGRPAAAEVRVETN